MYGSPSLWFLCRSRGGSWGFSPCFPTTKGRELQRCVRVGRGLNKLSESHVRSCASSRASFVATWAPRTEARFSGAVESERPLVNCAVRHAVPASSVPLFAPVVWGDAISLCNVIVINPGLCAVQQEMLVCGVCVGDFGFMPAPENKYIL